MVQQEILQNVAVKMEVDDDYSIIEDYVNNHNYLTNLNSIIQ